MFLLVAIGLAVWKLWDGSALEKLLLSLAALPAVFHLLHLLGVTLPLGRAWNLPTVGLLVLSAAWGLHKATRGGLRLEPKRLWNLDTLLTWGLFLLALGLWENAYRKSFVLPAHDPIAVPTLGWLIASDGSLAERFQPGDPVAAYPPGFPMLMSTVFALFESRDLAWVLWVFKQLNLLVLAAIPAVWAHFCGKLFFPALRSRGLLTLCFYLGFYCIERTLNFTLPLAGKNSQLLCGLFLPFVTFLFVRAPRSWKAFGGALLATLGLLLIHYSGLYMLFAMGSAYLLFHWRQQSLRSVGVYAGLASLVLALFAPVILRVKAQGAELASSSGNLSEAVRTAQGFLLSHDSGLFTIFHELGHPWPYKQLVLALGAVGVSLAAGWARRRRHEPLSEVLVPARDAAWMMMAILGFGVVLASGFIPRSGINADYVRWFLFFFSACLASLVAFAAVHSMVELSRGQPGVIRAGGWVVLGAAVAYVFAGDHRTVRRAVAEQKILRTELDELSSVLSRLAEGRECLLITESAIFFDGRAMQYYKPLEYAELVSGCRVLNGSWIRKARPAWREVVDGPSAEALSTLPENAAVLLIATREHGARYQQALPGFHLEPKGLALGPYTTWALERKAARPREGTPGE
jgi:hypothetical protein